MRNYQLVLLLKSDLKKEQKDKLFEDIKKMSGKVSSEKIESLGEKKLAYPIKSAKKGEYVVLSFESDKIDDDFNKKLNIREELLRFILVRN